MGKQEIVLRHTTLRNLATAGTTSGLVIRTVRWLGRGHVDDQTRALLAMFFGAVPTFDEIIRVVGDFERAFNGGKAT